MGDRAFRQGGGAAKYGYGFYPLRATLDAAEEPLVIPLRPGKAGSGTAADPIQVLDAALAPFPVDPATEPVIVRTDSAGCSHALLAAGDARGVRFSVGRPVSKERDATVTGRHRLPNPAITGDGTAERDVGVSATALWT